MGDVETQVTKPITVTRSSVKTDPYTCPKCNSTNITTFGSVERSFTKTYKEGQDTPEDIELGDKLHYRVIIMQCDSCSKVFRIEEDEVFERESLIFDLSTQVALLSGRLVPASSMIQ